MNPQDRDAIEGVFARLQSVARQGAPRDAEAEAYIRERLAAQPGADYYLAQTVLVQEQALQAAQQRIAELEARADAAPTTGASRPAGGLGFFGRQAGQAGGAAAPAAASPLSADAGFGRNARPGGGFLAGAMQTAVGVAGGLMLGNLLGGLFGAGTAQAAEPAAESEPAAPADEAGFEEGYDDGGGFDDI